MPAAVIVTALQRLREKEGVSTTSSSSAVEGGTAGSAPSPPAQLPYSPAVFNSTSDAYIDVEVETKQGYVYAGKLVDLDREYNMVLREATVRRERPCDVVRATRRHQRRTLLAQLGSLAPPELLMTEQDGERDGAATRPRYLGSVLIRSSNLLMARFPRAPAQPSSSPGVSTATGAPQGKGDGKTKPDADPRDLRAAYTSAAVAVKKAMQRERNKNREARRKRLAAIKKKKEGG